MSNVDDTTIGTGPYLNDDAFDFRTLNNADIKIQDIATNPRKFIVVVSIESASMGCISKALSEISDKIAGGIPAGTKGDRDISYSFNKRVVQ